MLRRLFLLALGGFGLAADIEHHLAILSNLSEVG